MTRFILLIAAAAFGFVHCQAQQDFKAVLQQTYTAFDTTENMDLKMNASNKLGLIAKKWPDEWTTHYYNAYSKVQLSYREKDASKRDAYLDEAEKEHDEAVALLKKENDETYVEAMKTKLEIYKREGLQLIEITKNELENLKAFLTEKLKLFHFQFA